MCLRLLRRDRRLQSKNSWLANVSTTKGNDKIGLTHDMLRQRLLRPLPPIQIRRTLNQVPDIPLDGITLHILQLLIFPIRRHIDARPASKQRQRTLVVAVLREVPVLGVCLFLSTTENWAELREDFETGWIAALRCHLRADVGDGTFHACWAMRRDKYRFCVFSSERAASSARSGLHYHGCALRRRLADMRPRDGEVFALVVDFADQRRISVNSGFGVELDCVRAPGRIPQLVDDGHVFFANGVALVVFGLVLAVGQVAGGGVEVPGYDVPSHPSSGEMIDCAEAAGEVVGLLVGC